MEVTGDVSARLGILTLPNVLKRDLWIHIRSYKRPALMDGGARLKNMSG